MRIATVSMCESFFLSNICAFLFIFVFFYCKFFDFAMHFFRLSIIYIIPLVYSGPKSILHMR